MLQPPLASDGRVANCGAPQQSTTRTPHNASDAIGVRAAKLLPALGATPSSFRGRVWRRRMRTPKRAAAGRLRKVDRGVRTGWPAAAA